jgi:hypothetical protein
MSDERSDTPSRPDLRYILDVARQPRIESTCQIDKSPESTAPQRLANGSPDETGSELSLVPKVML